MGNSSTTSPPPSVSTANISTNISGGGHSFGGVHSFGFLWSLLLSSGDNYSQMVSQCQVETGKLGWLGVKIFVLVTAFLANAALMWLLLRRRRAMTASEVLGLNVSLMDVLYCLCLPLDIYSTLRETCQVTRSVREALFALSLFGCPLLLTFMCLERYVAAARPVTFIRLDRWEYRAVLCAAAWLLTLTVVLLGFYVRMFVLALALSVTISLLFLLMLMSLLAIAAVLRQSGPGEASASSAPLKRRALKNIVAVMVPSVVAYSPLVALVPYVSVIVSQPSDGVSAAQCRVLQVLLLFPNFGLFIGPAFYLSRFRQVICCGREQLSLKTQAE
ncbi:somatostatin receptor type 1-like [Plectropomus leopardus]|uniref:somatostatin receptor type 1-like n=1 Tax=Plectropomus leopardus TaxID=160734 RepID=UPI001C4B9B14|nr:somatostatin receptor type 1-like [Plectropomus leopardus]